MAHDEKTHDAHHEPHALPVPMLIGVWLALMFFTALTVFVSRQGLGAQASFTIAMIIATIKAGMVMAIFMHLWWDRRINLLVFLGSFLFVLLFIGMALTDKTENKPDIDRKSADDAALSAGAK